MTEWWETALSNANQQLDTGLGEIKTFQAEAAAIRQQVVAQGLPSPNVVVRTAPNTWEVSGFHADPPPQSWRLSQTSFPYNSQPPITMAPTQPDFTVPMLALGALLVLVVVMRR